MHTAKFDAFLFDQSSLIKFRSISSNDFDEKKPIKIKIPTREEKSKK